MFEGKKTTPKQKRTRFFLALVIIFSMFAVRLVLIDQGVIGSDVALSDNELKEGLSSHEVRISTPLGTGRGTILLVSAQRGDNPDVVYIITTADILEEDDDTDFEITVSLPGGAEVTGKRGEVSSERNLAVVSIEENGLTACYFSEDDLYQKEKGTDVFWLSDEGELQKGAFGSAQDSVEGYDRNVLTADGSMDGTGSGSGMYDSTGYYLGMMLKEKDGKIISMPADQVYSWFRVNH